MPIGGDRGLSCLAALKTIATEFFELISLNSPLSQWAISIFYVYS